MANTKKVLAQNKPSATTLTDAYTVPANTQALCSSLVVCNQSGTDDVFRVSVAVAGAADAAKQYLFYDVTVSGNASSTWNLGITLGAADVVRVYSTNGTSSFSLFGIEST